MKHENCGVPLALSSQKRFQVCVSMDMSNKHHRLGVQLSQAHLIALKMRASQEKKKESECIHIFGGTYQLFIFTL